MRSKSDDGSPHERLGFGGGIVFQRALSVDGALPAYGYVLDLLGKDERAARIALDVRYIARLVRRVVAQLCAAQQGGTPLDVQGYVAFQYEGTAQVSAGGKYDSLSAASRSRVDGGLYGMGVEGGSVAFGAECAHVEGGRCIRD